MISRVLISKAVLGGFRKTAQKAYPNEVMNTLWGRIEGDSVIITHLRGVEQQVDESNVRFDPDDTVRPAAHTVERFLGTIHSHPDVGDASPSQQDWDDSFLHGEHVFGILNVRPGKGGKLKTEVAWWEPRPRIATIFPRVRRTKMATVTNTGAPFATETNET